MSKSGNNRRSLKSSTLGCMQFLARIPCLFNSPILISHREHCEILFMAMALILATVAAGNRKNMAVVTGRRRRLRESFAESSIDLGRCIMEGVMKGYKLHRPKCRWRRSGDMKRIE